MKKLSELGISPWPWRKEFCEFHDEESPFEIVVGDNVSSLDGQFSENDANLIAAAPKMFDKAWELIAAFDERVMTPGHVEALRAALAEAAGEEVANG